jgi:uridine kinase
MKIAEAVNAITERKREVPTQQAMLVGISGIDGSGKGYVTSQINDCLTAAGLKTAVINIDGWLNLPHVRFDPADLAGNFYRNGLRLFEMFDQLVLPLRKDRSIDLTADFAEEIATTFREHRYEFHDIDIILLEGIFLFKREFVDHFDLRIWIECPFETALSRAIVRSQEGLSPAETITAYETIYFPAQRLHFNLDNPQTAADIHIDN